MQNLRPSALLLTPQTFPMQTEQLWLAAGKAGKLTMRGRQGIKKHLTKKFYIVAIILLLLGVVGAGFSFDEYQTYTANYHTDVSLAQMGMQHLQKAQLLLEGLSQKGPDPNAVSQARGEFSSASTTFLQLDQNLNSLPGISTSMPIYGTRLNAALHLVPFAVELSETGITACDALNLLLAKFHNPPGEHSSGLTMADITTINQDFQHIKVLMNQAIDQANQVQPGDLQFDARVERTFMLFQKQIPTIQAWIGTVEKFIPVVPALPGIGTPANYLIEILDSTELRPAGGFIGNYGIATFSGGRLTAAHITDVDLLDRPFENAGKTIPYPSAYAWFIHYLGQKSWSLRDSNLDADFPTAASYAELNYTREGGKVPVQGVIAITPGFIQQMLEITGPIYLPEYKETITAQNLIDRIHYHQLGAGSEGGDTTLSPGGHSSLRKRFTELLSEHFFARIQHLSSSAFPTLFQSMMNAVRSKDIQLYLNSTVAENMLQRLHLDAAIQAPVGDSLLRVDANISPNKANQFIVNTVDDQVSIDGAGNATHHLSIKYAWTIAGQAYGVSVYRDYLRVYAPPESTLQSQVGWQAQGTDEAFGRKVWAGFFRLTYGQTHTITLVWTVPHAATKDSNGWHYSYLVQRQAGVQWMMHVQITLPSCATMTGTSGGIVSKSTQSAMLTTSLTDDMNFAVDYHC